MKKIILGLLIMCAYFYTGCDEEITGSNAENIPDTDLAKPMIHPGDIVADHWNNSPQLLKNYPLVPHPDLRFEDSIGAPPYGTCLTRMYYKNQLVRRISWLQHGGPGYIRPGIGGAWVNSAPGTEPGTIQYILYIQIGWPTMYSGTQLDWYIIRNNQDGIHLLPKTQNLQSSDAIFENSVLSCDVRKYSNTLIFHGTEYNNKETFCELNISLPSIFHNYYRVLSGPTTWQWQ